MFFIATVLTVFLSWHYMDVDSGEAMTAAICPILFVLSSIVLLILISNFFGGGPGSKGPGSYEGRPRRNKSDSDFFGGDTGGDFGGDSFSSLWVLHPINELLDAALPKLSFCN